MPSRNTKPRSSADKRLKANRPPERQAKPREKSRYQQLIDGDIDVEDLDDDEIMEGRCKAKNGKFVGRPPKTFPRALHDALRREFHKRMNEKWQLAASIGPEVLLEIATNTRASADARVKATIYLTERVMGKIPDKVEQTIQLKPFEEDIAGLLVEVPDEGNVFNITSAPKAKDAS